MLPKGAGGREPVPSLHPGGKGQSIEQSYPNRKAGGEVQGSGARTKGARIPVRSRAWM